MTEAAQALLDALEPFDSPNLLTPDERLALDILRHALKDILKGGDLSPEIEGVLPHKLRLWRRLSLGYVQPETPRPVLAKPPLATS